jgi:hypothetical protein
MWDMTSPERTKQFIAGAELFVEEIERETEGVGYTPAFRHDGHPALLNHLKNAKRYPTRDGVSLWKGQKDSAKKIDLAVCAAGARLLRRLVLNRGVDEAKAKGGRLWGA